MRPVGAFLKWAGGKARLASQIVDRVDDESLTIERYHEPFVGGGAVFFALRDEGLLKAASLSDGNEALIEAYKVVRDDRAKLLRHLGEHQRKYRSSEGGSQAKYYYKGRDRTRPTSPAGRAARLIFLNKTCFNGLYRVNSQGRFNVPHGRHPNPRILDKEGLRDASEALQGTQIQSMDFEEACASAEPGDFVYLDPPYQPLSATSAFTKYTSGDFGTADQERLRDAFDDLTTRGVHALLSNSEHPDVRELYDGYSLEEVPMGRNINSKATERSAITELLISNFDALTLLKRLAKRSK